MCYTLLDPIRANHLLSELKEPAHLSCPSCSVLWLIWKINQRRISLFEALLGMAVREVQKKLWGMSPETLFHIVLLLLTQNWFILLNRVFLQLLHLPFHQQLYLEGLWTAHTLTFYYWVSLTLCLMTSEKSFNCLPVQSIKITRSGSWELCSSSSLVLPCQRGWNSSTRPALCLSFLTCCHVKDLIIFKYFKKSYIKHMSERHPMALECFVTCFLLSFFVLNYCFAGWIFLICWVVIIFYSWTLGYIVL